MRSCLCSALLQNLLLLTLQSVQEPLEQVRGIQHCTPTISPSSFPSDVAFSDTLIDDRTLQSLSPLFLTSLTPKLHPPGEASKSGELILLWLVVQTLQLGSCGAKTVGPNEVLARTGSPKVAESSKSAVVLPNGEETPSSLSGC